MMIIIASPHHIFTYAAMSASSGLHWFMFTLLFRTALKYYVNFQNRDRIYIDSSSNLAKMKWDRNPFSLLTKSP